MSDKPNPLAEEIQQARRPRINVALPSRQDLPDDTVAENSREIGEKWGAATQMAPRLPVEIPKPTAPLNSVRFDCPDYLDEELAVRAASTKGPNGEKVTKTYLILRALRQAGYRVEDVDLITDRRRQRPKAVRP